MTENDRLKLQQLNHLLKAIDSLSKVKKIGDVVEELQYANERIGNMIFQLEGIFQQQAETEV